MIVCKASKETYIVDGFIERGKMDNASVSSRRKGPDIFIDLPGIFNGTESDVSVYQNALVSLKKNSVKTSRVETETSLED